MSVSFRVLMLGPFAVCRDGAPIDTVMWPGRSASLLKLLAAAPEHRLSRDEIVDALWPEATPEAGRSNARYVLHLLRRSLGSPDPPAVLSSRGWIWLSPDYRWDIDVDRLAEASSGQTADVGALEGIAELVRGEPLIENRYDDWAAPIRRRLQSQWRDLRLRLGRLHRDCGALDRSVFWLRHALDTDPADEEVLEELLRGLIAMERFADAIREYGDYEAYVRHELGVEPGPRVQALLAGLPGRDGGRDSGDERVAAGDGAARVPVVPRCLPPGHTPLVGRETELSQVLDGLTEENGQPRLLLLAGATGVGKTRILAEAAARARARGVLTLAGRCYEQEGRIPYGPIHDALADYIETQPRPLIAAQLEGLPAALGDVVPEARGFLPAEEPATSGDTSDRRLSVFVAVSDLLERLVGAGPAALLFDDLQWADELSLQLIHFLGRRDQLRGLHLLGAFRTDEPQPGTAPLFPAPGEADSAMVISVGSFDRSAVSALCAAELGGPCADDLITMLEGRSGGNAFFLLQLLAVLREGGSLAQSSGVWTVPEGVTVTLPHAVRGVIARRLSSLPPAEREVLRLGAVLGQEFGFAPLEMLWKGDGDLFAALDGLTSARLVHETGDGYAFSHPLLHEAVYDAIASHARRRLHLQAGTALETVYGSKGERHAAELAYHFLRGNDLDRALPLVVRAGEQAEAAHAYNEAAGFYGTAIELTRGMQAADGSGSRNLADVLLKAGAALRMTVRNEEAIAALREAASIYDALGVPLGECRALVNLAKACVRAGKGQEALQPLERAEMLLRDSDLGPPGPELSALYDVLGNLYFRMSRYEELLAARERQIGVARAMGDERVLVRAEVGRALAVGMLGRFRESGLLVEEIMPRVESSEDAETLRLALALAAESAMVMGSFGASRVYREREITVSERLPGAGTRPFSLSNLAQLLLYLGEWDAARLAASEALDQLLAIGTASRAVYPRTYIGELALREGRWDEAEGRLRECAQVAGRIGDLQALRYVVRLLAELDLLGGRPQAAVDRLAPYGDRSGGKEHDVTSLLPTLAWAYLDAGDVDRARDAISEACERAETQENRLAQVEIHRVQGMILMHGAEWTEAGAAFRASERLARGMPYPYAEGRALLAHGMICIKTCQRERAEKDVRRAHEIFRQLGALKDIDRTDQALLDVERLPA